MPENNTNTTIPTIDAEEENIKIETPEFDVNNQSASSTGAGTNTAGDSAEKPKKAAERKAETPKPDPTSRMDKAGLYTMESVITPDANSDDSRGYGSRTRFRAATKAQKDAYERRQKEANEQAVKEIRAADEALRRAKTDEERKAAKEQKEKAVNKLVGHAKIMQYRIDENGKKDLLLIPQERFPKDAQFRGGDVQFTFALDELMKSFGNSTDAMQQDIFKNYTILRDMGNPSPAMSALLNYLTRNPDIAKNGINPRIFSSVTDMMNEGEKLKEQMVALFVQYKKDEYEALKQEGVDDFQATAKAFEKLVRNMGEVIDSHAKFALMLQGNEVEKTAAKIILTEAWTSASADFRIQLDEEIKKLSPEQLRKIGEARLQSALKDFDEGKKYLEGLINNDQSLMSLIMMAAFCPPLLFVALLPTLTLFGFAAAKKLHAAMAEMGNDNQEHYGKIDERIRQMSATGVTDALVKSFIDLNSTGRGNLYLNAVNTLLHPEASATPGVIGLDKIYFKLYNDLKYKGDKDNPGLNLIENYEKLIDPASDVGRPFMKLMKEVYTSSNLSKQQIIDAINEQGKKMEENLEKRGGDQLKILEQELAKGGVDPASKSFSETMLKMMKTSNWFIDAYTPHSIEELAGHAINNGSHYENNGLRGVFDGATPKVLNDFYKRTTDVNLMLKNADPELVKQRDISEIDMKARLMTAFGKYHEEDEGATKIGLGYMKSAFMSDYLSNAVKEIMDKQIAEVDHDQTLRNKLSGPIAEMVNDDIAKGKQINDVGEEINKRIHSAVEEIKADVASKKDELLKTLESNNVWNQTSEKAGYDKNSEITSLMQQFSLAMAAVESYGSQVQNVAKSLNKADGAVPFGDAQINMYYQQALQEAVNLRDKINGIDDQAFSKFQNAANEIKEENAAKVSYLVKENDNAKIRTQRDDGPQMPWERKPVEIDNPDNLANNWKAVSMAIDDYNIGKKYQDAYCQKVKAEAHAEEGRPDSAPKTSQSVHDARRERGNRMGRAWAATDPDKYVDPNIINGTADRNPQNAFDEVEQKADFINHSVQNIMTVANQETVATLDRYIDRAKDMTIDPEQMNQAKADLITAKMNAQQRDRDNGGIEHGTDPDIISLTLGASESQVTASTQLLASQEVGHDMNNGYRDYGNKDDDDGGWDNSFERMAAMGAFDPTR